MKVIVLSLFVVIFIVNFVIKLLHLKNDNKPKENYVSDIYNEEEYATWQSYQMANVRVVIFSLVLAFIVTMLLFSFNIHSYVLDFINSLTSNLYLQSLLVVVFFYLIEIYSIFISYYKIFKIEEKYGFNKTTKGLFVKDQIIQFFLVIILGGSFLYLVNVIYNNFNNPFIFLLITTVIVVVIALTLPFFMPIFSRLFNKQTVLEDGELKEKIFAYANKVNFPVNNIYVIDASKRSSKMNAYFLGYGKKRRIVLYDTLLNSFTDDEIIAVLAHEAGHAKHKDFLRLLPLTILSVVVMLAVLYLFVTSNELAAAFGFSGSNFVFGLFLFFEVQSIIDIILGTIRNGFSRRIEYQADRYSATTHTKEHIISALKNLSRANFANLFPHPAIVFIYYSHPTLNQRISAINKI